LNMSVQQFPTNLIANMFNIGTEKFFEINESEKIAPKVEF
jgi:hypothetical protein